MPSESPVLGKASMALMVKAATTHTELGLRAALRKDLDVDMEQRKVSGLG